MFSNERKSSHDSLWVRVVMQQQFCNDPLSFPLHQLFDGDFGHVLNVLSAGLVFVSGIDLSHQLWKDDWEVVC